MKLYESITTVKGIGPKRSALYKKIGITRLIDALEYYPREYEERGAVKAVTSIQDGMEVSLCLEFSGTPRVNRIKRGFSTTVIAGNDETGKAECIWFNQPFRGAIYKQGIKYFVRGKAEKKGNKFLIQNPIVEEYDTSVHNEDQLLPVYPLTSGLTQRDLRSLIGEAIKYVDELSDGVDRYIMTNFNSTAKSDAIRNIHYPDNGELLQAARQRLAFEEFFIMQTAVQYTKKWIRDKVDGIKIAAVLSYPFTLLFFPEAVDVFNPVNPQHMNWSHSFTSSLYLLTAGILFMLLISIITIIYRFLRTKQ